MLKQKINMSYMLMAACVLVQSAVVGVQGSGLQETARATDQSSPTAPLTPPPTETMPTPPDGPAPQLMGAAQGGELALPPVQEVMGNTQGMRQKIAALVREEGPGLCIPTLLAGCMAGTCGCPVLPTTAGALMGATSANERFRWAVLMVLGEVRKRAKKCLPSASSSQIAPAVSADQQ